MKITKLGHCCMLIEEGGARLLIDPGVFTAEKYSSIIGIDAILYTHEHVDHYHLQSLQVLIKGNPKVAILCNGGVATQLSRENIPHEVLGDGSSTLVRNVLIEGHGSTHAVIHSSLPAVQNTGFLIAGKLWYPGDELIVDPGVKPEIMALPLAGPWMKLSEAVDYALKIQPKTTFPVHDMILNASITGFVPQTTASILEPRGVKFFPIELDREYDF
jgi:L-ascorbate metabolism protein UlaG (beta-lactamase superfamily)